MTLGSPPAFACGLPVAARDSARESAAIDAARCSLDGSSCERTSSSTAPSWARLASRSDGLLRRRSASSRSSSASCVRGSLASAPLPSSSLATSSIRSAWRSASSRTCAVLRDHGVLRVGQEHRRHDEGDGDERDEGRPRREARPEQPRVDRMQPAERVAALAADEPLLGRVDVEAGADVDRLVRRLVDGRRGGRGAGERERGGDRVADAALGVDGERGLAQRRSGPRDHDEEHEQPDHRDRGREHGRALERPDPLRDHEQRARRRRRRRGPSSRGGPHAGATAAGDARRGPSGAVRAPGRARRPASPDRRGRTRPAPRRRTSAERSFGIDGIRRHLRWAGVGSDVRGSASAGWARRAGRTGRSGSARSRPSRSRPAASSCRAAPRSRCRTRRC